MVYSESDTRFKLIDPCIKDSDWLESNIVRVYFFTDGRKIIGNKRGKRCFVDYLLTYKNTNLAIIEVKAVQKLIESISNGKDRVLLTLATGTGKTYIAFQIVYRLFQSKWNRDESDRRSKILFLADRNVLKDQSMNTFNPLEKEVVIPKRTELIAKTILENMNRMDKTIVFCVNQKHSLDMKIAIDKFKSIKDNHYCVRVTSDEGEIGREFLEKFQNNDFDIPTILTSSKMLTTGVDAKNVRNVVLTAPIKSMTELKQIIGRGTRVFEGKDFFTILDFVGATNLFYDPKWDGEDFSDNGAEEKHQSDKAKEFIEFILQRYKKDGVKELDEDKLGRLVDLSGLGSVREVAQNFGGISEMRDEYFELQREIYR